MNALRDRPTTDDDSRRDPLQRERCGLAPGPDVNGRERNALGAGRGGFDAERSLVLPPIARGAIAEALGVPFRVDESASWLAELRATFVTLTRDGELRGCIGTLEARRTLREDVRENALGAAFRDPRFPPLRRVELDRISVEVSVLSAPEPVVAGDEEALIARLRPFVDGVIVRLGWQRATFLPQVWEKIPDPREFLAELKCKAGLPFDFWSTEMTVERYTVDKYVEVRDGSAAQEWE